MGEDFRAAARTHPKPSAQGALGSFAVVKWTLSHGNEVSVTASPDTGKIVFVESDWGDSAADAATEIPGLTFGKTNLSDIRGKFQSNGFGFKDNAVKLIGPDVVSFNCYEIKGSDNVVVVFVTVLPVASIPTVSGSPSPDVGRGRLVSVILAKLDYLKSIWGEDRLFDPTYQPVDWN